MSKQVTGSQKFASLEIVDSAKFDNEIVFDDLAMVGSNLSIICSEDITISSTGTSSPWGINILSVGPITVSSTQGHNWILAGFNDTLTPSSGTVSIGHSTDTSPVSAFSVEYDSFSDSSKIGMFGVTPVEQPTESISEATITPGVIADNVVVDTKFGGYTIGQVVQALKTMGILS